MEGILTDISGDGGYSDSDISGDGGYSDSDISGDRGYSDSDKWDGGYSD